ncbi:hypothetical protein DFH07DRAFT_782474 [Mycena maculata]|uniref:Uncharacterized protein n=1 Tax=Mycena maculata TaxID=230809 RepID=A0AAD7HTU4_9AGAR|nr:hypothetical protein DFH07DRAFT_782474 [Mycena maculata]
MTVPRAEPQNLTPPLGEEAQEGKERNNNTARNSPTEPKTSPTQTCNRFNILLASAPMLFDAGFLDLALPLEDVAWYAIRSSEEESELESEMEDEVRSDSDAAVVFGTSAARLFHDLVLDTLRHVRHASGGAMARSTASMADIIAPFRVQPIEGIRARIRVCTVILVPLPARPFALRTLPFSPRKHHSVEVSHPGCLEAIQVLLKVLEKSSELLEFGILLPNEEDGIQDTPGGIEETGFVECIEKMEEVDGHDVEGKRKGAKKEV